MILPHMQMVTLSALEYREVVRHCADSGMSGGKVHDAVHLRCAAKASCKRIYTFNVRDFRALSAPGQADKIVAP
jgi:predicted nucleic acid-binding protein